MSEPKFTKGEWSVPHFAMNDVRCNCAYVLSEGHMGSIATVDIDNGLEIGKGGNDSPALEEAIANAHLIAAAPELYAELAHLVRFFEPIEETGLNVPGLATLNGARAALAKARGE